MAHGRREGARGGEIPWAVDRGFSLIELAVAVVILSLLFGGLLTPLAVQWDVRQAAETRRILDDVREALLGYAVAHGHLPCPDQLGDGDGLADGRVDGLDVPAEGCRAGEYEGWVPWATLGVAPGDAWGRRLRYRVSREFTRRAGDPSAVPCLRVTGKNPCTLEIGDAGDLAVATRDPQTRTERTLARELPVLVVSLGPNGLGGVDVAGRPVAPGTPPWDDERRNLDRDAVFLARDRTPGAPGCRDSSGGAPLCEFDDLVAWISPHILLGRLVSAGQLP